MKKVWSPKFIFMGHEMSMKCKHIFHAHGMTPEKHTFWSLNFRDHEICHETTSEGMTPWKEFFTAKMIMVRYSNFSQKIATAESRCHNWIHQCCDTEISLYKSHCKQNNKHTSFVSGPFWSSLFIQCGVFVFLYNIGEDWLFCFLEMKVHFTKMGDFFPL